MSRYVLRRVLAIVPVLLGVAVIVFAILKMVPGDPARMVAGLDATEEDIVLIRHQLGLDRPLLQQFGAFLSRAVQGDFGRSIRSRRPVVEEIAARLPATVELAVASMLLAVLIGLTTGVLASIRPYTLLDNASIILAISGVSMPVFWLGLMLMLVFSVKLGLLPTTGRGSLQHLILPAVTLGAASSAIIARMVRASMLEVLGQDYVRTARAKGLAEARVVVRHALKNALIPAVTIVGLQFGYLLGGAVITETVFAWPGIGRLLVDAIKFRDFPVVQATLLVLAFTFTLVNLAVDLLYGYLDPRIKYG